MQKLTSLRAYLAGSAIPTGTLLLIMTVYTIMRFVYDVPVPVERLIVFPMAAVPNAWGLWNLLWVAVLEKRRISLGIFGGALPLLLIPAGLLVTRLVSFSIPDEVLHYIPFLLVIAPILYYLVWKHFVGFLNAELGLG
jgi:hypothetical protein